MKRKTYYSVFRKIKCEHEWEELDSEYSWCKKCGVLVEVDYMYGDSPNYYWIPDITKESIKKSKQKMYTEEEMIKLLIKYGEHVSEQICGEKLSQIGELHKWAKENNL